MPVDPAPAALKNGLGGSPGFLIRTTFRPTIREYPAIGGHRAPDTTPSKSYSSHTRVHFGENRAMINKSLSVLEAKLDPGMFFRASRAHIINLQQISSLQPQPDGALLATLSGGMQIPVSRRQSRNLKERLSL